MILNCDIVHIVYQILMLLSRKNYSSIVEITHGIRLSNVDIKYGIEKYGRTLIEPPVNFAEHINAVLIPGSTPSWSIQTPVWTREEGLSDLTVELTARYDDCGLAIELDDIHVL